MTKHRSVRIARGAVLAGLIWMGGAAGLFPAAASAADFLSWGKKLPITFSGYPDSRGTLTDFPVLVVLSTNIAGFSYDQFQSPLPADLRFTDATETNALNYEVEKWDATGNSYVWVQVRTLTNNASIFAFWQKAGEAAPACTTNGATWNSAYRGVWHMQNVNPPDSTANNYDGTAPVGVSTITGAVGPANSFDGTGDISVPSVDLFNGSEDVTVEFWINCAASQVQYADILDYNHDTVPYANFVVQRYGDPLNFSWAVNDMSDSWGPWNAGQVFALTSGQWIHVTLTKSGTTYKYFMNGSQTSSAEYQADLDTAVRNMKIGGNVNLSSRVIVGVLDEMRVSNVGRSPDWVWATWMNTASNGVFSTNAAVQSGGLAISNQDATNVTTSAAYLNGHLASTGDTPITVSVYWGKTDGGTNINGWAKTNVLSSSASVGSFSELVSLDTPNVTWYYRFRAADSSGIYWAPSSATLISGAVTIEATDSTASEKPGNTGTFRVSRPADATNADLTVHYTISGTAGNGIDYTALSSSAIIPAGSSNVTLTVTPILDVILDDGETVAITLAPGTYAVGSPSDATVTIGEAFTFAQTDDNIWTGDGDWNTAGNWSQTRIPVDGDAVTINGSVVLSNTPAVLSSLDVTAGNTLTFSNGNFSLIAAAVTVGGTVTHVPNSDTIATDGWTPDARVDLVCSSLTVAANGIINADSKGYAGGPVAVAGTYGSGPGRGGDVNGAAGGCGGGYGGRGGNTYPPQDTPYIGLPYGSAETPTDPGSGGGAGSFGAGGAGGGAIRITAGDAVLVHGTVSANGNNGPAGGGSGGGVYIVCHTFGGASGLISARGGNGSQNNSAGGGGRIAIVADAAAQAAAPQHGVVFDAARGLYDNVPKTSRPGTIYLSTPALLTGLQVGGQLMVPGMSTWAPSSLTFSNSLTVIANQLQLAVTNNLLFTAGGGLELPNATVSAGGNLDMGGASEFYLWSPSSGGTSLWVGGNMTLDAGSVATWYGNATNVSFVRVNGNLVLTNSSSLTAYSGATNSPTPGYGASVMIGGSVTLSGNSWIRPFSDHLNGGSIRFDVDNLSILTTDAGFSADGGGYYRSTAGEGNGPGGGKYCGNQYNGGGGYGGKGGDFIAVPPDPNFPPAAGGATYGSAEEPLQPGSSGGQWSAGGGLVWIVASGSATLDGVLRANGGPGYNGSGGASGGGIYLSCKTLRGTSGILQANGGAGSNYQGPLGGGGGGGRIAVWKLIDQSNTNGWTIQALGYTVVNPGADGTIFWGQTINATPGTIIYLR